MLHIYKASAGSGKTYTLVREFLRMAIKKPDQFKHILAITFTNKAANEMKERIISTLQQVKKGEEKSQQLIHKLGVPNGMDEAEVMQQAGKILRSLLHSYADLNVSTIDSFVHRVIRSFTYDLHLPMNFEVEMDRDKLLTETIELLMDGLSDADDELTNAIVEYAEQNIEDGKSWNLEFSLMRLGKELFNEDTFPFLKQLNEVDLKEAKGIREALYKFVSAFEQKLFDEGKQAYKKIIDAGLTAQSFHYTTTGIFGFFQKYANETLPNEPLGNTRVAATINDEKWKGSKVTEAELAGIESIKDDLTLHYQKIVGHFSSAGQDYYLAKLLLRNFYSFVLLADMEKLMEQYKKENNILHISEFQRRVHEIVKVQDAPVIYERIGEWFDNILIDEHQDTSVLQWQNLLPLIENSQFKSEDSLVVGDGKQAIYRFRNGKVEQFAALPKIYGAESNQLLREREVAITNYGIETNTLEYNFRSRKAIVDFNNSLYETLRTAPELKNKSIYEAQTQLQGRDADGGYVSIEFLEHTDETDLDTARCLRVEAIIQSALQKGYALKDIALLTRSNANGTVLASYLMQQGIRVISSESLLIDNSPAVKLILSVLTYFDQKENHISRAEIAYYIHLLLLKKEFRFEQFNFQCEAEEFEKKISKLIGKEFNSSSFINSSLVDLIQELIDCFTLNDDDSFIQFFTDEALVFSKRNRNNIREFLLWWEDVKHGKSIIYPDTLDAVKIMTIHKSKGLQFPVVIMADADWPQKNTKNNFWIPINKPWLKKLNLGIIPVTKDVLKTEFAALYEEEEASSFLDVLNLVYVATTRAEDMLYILSTEPAKEPVANNSVTALCCYFLKQQDLWDGFKQYEFGDSDTVKLGSSSNKSVAVFEKGERKMVEKKADRISIRKDSQLLWSEASKEKINWGNLLHSALRQIKYADDAPRVLAKLLNEGVINKAEQDKLQSEISDLMSNSSIKHLFEAPYRIINERAFLSKTATKIPDRIAIKDGEAVILDYKTGDKNARHKQQLNDYAAELNSFGYSSIRKFLVYTELREVEELV